MSVLSKKFIIFCAEYLVIAVGLVFLLLVLKQPTSPQMVTTVLSGGCLLLMALAVTKILKRIIHKRRPPRKVEFFMPFDTYALPSGHATALFSVTLFIFTQDVLLGVISLLLSLAIVTGRVLSRVHDTIDIAAGVIIGTSITYVMMPAVLEYVSIYLTPAVF